MARASWLMRSRVPVQPAWLLRSGLWLLFAGLSALPAWAADPPPALAGTATPPESPELQGDALFAQGRYPEAAAWYQIALQAEPGSALAWKLAMARWGSQDGMGALTAVDQVLAREPTHAAAKQARPLLAEWVRMRGTSGTAVPMVPQGRSIRMAVLHALVEGDEVLARQLLPLWRSGPERGVVAELVQAELFLRDDRLADADRVLRAILAKQPTHAAALKALAEVVIRRGDLQQARAMVGLPTLRPSSQEDPNADLYRFVLRRRAEWQRQIRMAVDPGVKPLPALQTQLAEAELAAAAPAQAEAPVQTESTPAAEPVAAAKPAKRGHGVHRKVAAPSPSPSKTLVTRAHKPKTAKKK